MTSMTPPMANGTLDSSETNGKNFWSHKALGIYLLNLFLAFLQPKFDPSLEMDIAESEVEEGPSLPTKADEEFRPFIRRLPEFKFW
ncbi:32554_t:CDS:2 [Gigaspora margarita]|uniref:32554_t:CDS:1 n=1 Tax=Gigaspora margarita TaxID=4874 RepID=A0ABN7UYF8_GIGMA|nr:32554_t:CDS:2 [Gigaspora margarita]